MAELKSARRLSYKATYNQISPAATTRSDGKRPTKSLTRAIEKTAFVQSLRITPQELTVLKDQLSGRANVSADISPSTSSALSAIEILINDRTATSTLNNAAMFTQVDPPTLVAIANCLIAHRQTVSDRVNKSIADIVSAYRGAFVNGQRTK